MLQRPFRSGLALLGLLMHPISFAHHSSTEYDSGKIVEFDGELIEIHWVNPHVLFKVEVRDQAGGIKTWNVEGASLSILRRTNATPKNLKIGDTIKVAGWVSRVSASKLFLTNLLPKRGPELILGMGSTPRWNKTAAGLQTTWLNDGDHGKQSAGIFKVWSTKFNSPEGFLWKRFYPLTDTARRIVSRWNPVTDLVARGCTPKGMPTIMEQPYPMKFVDKGKFIELHMEEYDTVRTIYMTPASSAIPKVSSILGYSIGRWDGSTLVVSTDHISWRYFDSSGVPLSTNASIVERFTPDTTGSKLNYTITVTDSETFTQPIVLERSWVWRQSEEVKPYDCIENSAAKRK